MSEWKTQDVSVVICAYADNRWEQILAAVESLRTQTLPPVEIVVVIDHNPALLARACSHFSGENAGPHILVVENAEPRGLSGGRNTAIAASSGALIGFLDDDAVAAADWLERLVACFDDPTVLAAGGAVDARWATRQPGWFPGEFLWVVGCSYRGLPLHKAPVRNVMGGCSLVRRSVFTAVGGFRSEIGRVGKRPAGCEETELAIRAHQHFPDGRFIYEPVARIAHYVPAERTRWSYFRSRCYFEGRSKALVAQLVGASDALATERSYTRRVLPLGIARDVAAVLRGDLAGLSRAAAIVGGLGYTAAGYLVGTLELRRGARGKATPAAPGISALTPSACTRSGADAARMQPDQRGSQTHV